MFTDFYESYHWLYNHPLFQEKIKSNYRSHFYQCIKIDVVKVNPETLIIDDDKSKNTKVVIWLECGKYNKKYEWYGIGLECGGDTFESAIIELANLVMEWYGEGKERIEKSDWED